MLTVIILLMIVFHFDYITLMLYYTRTEEYCKIAKIERFEIWRGDENCSLRSVSGTRVDTKLYLLQLTLYNIIMI